MTHRILHLADLHLDRGFAQMGCQGELARRRRQGLRDALRRAGEEARARGCIAVSIAGDLFEHERAGADTAQFLAETFAAWQPIRVLLAPGNHDPLVPGSLYLRTRWPENVHLFTASRLEPVELLDGLTVWGLGHPEPVWLGDPLDVPRVGGDGGVHLALFHGAEIGSRPEGKSIHGPFRAGRIHDRGFAAALCGHYHRRRLDAATGLVYPGSPEPLSFDESERRGPVLVEIDNNSRVTTTGLALNRWFAAIVSCDIGDAATITAAVDAMSAAVLAATAGLPLERTTLRLDLSGDVRPGLAVDRFDAETAVRETTGIAAIRVRDLSAPAIDLDAVTHDPTARGAFLRSARTALAAAETGEDRTLIEEAIGYGLQALSGGEVGLR
jgi:exonuclease SbcD